MDAVEMNPVRASSVVCAMANEGPKGIGFVNAALAQYTDFKRVTFLSILENATKDNTRVD